MKVKTLMMTAALALASVVGVGLMSGEAFAEVNCPQGSIRGDAGQSAASYAECNLPVEETERADLMKTVVTIINVIIGVVGVIAVVVIVIGGVFYVISTGEAAKTTRAKNTILYGLVGLVVSLLAFAIVNFVLTTVFGSGNTGGSTGDGSGGSTTTEQTQTPNRGLNWTPENQNTV